MKTSQQSTDSDFNQATSQPMMRNAGFALVIALSMMSFVLVLILSFTVMVTVETTNSSRAKQQLLARENARLGMLIAVGKLQQIAGPDERAMARAEAFESNSTSISNGQWLGIIDANTPTNDLAEINWLTSQDEADPILPSEVLNDSNSAIIIPSIETTQGTSIPEVRVPLVDITDSTQQFAYWVSDESMKASIATSPEIDGQDSDWLEDTFGASNAKRLDQVIPKRTGVEMLFTSNDLDSTAIYRELNKINSLKQLPLATAWDMANFTDFFHDITDRTYGVLASTTGSGLRKDLSLRPDLMPIPGRFEELYNFADYMEEPLEAYDSSTPYIPFEDDLRRRYEIRPPTTTTDGEISDGIYPVLTSFRILLAVHVAGSNVKSKTESSFNPITDEDELVVRVQIHAELWNPYTSALVPENLVLRIDNLPTVQVELEDGDDESLGTYSINLGDVLGNGGGRGRDALSGYFIELPFTDRNFPNNHDDFSWLPGRIYNWTGQNNYSNGNVKTGEEGFFYSRSLSSSIFYKGTGITTPSSTEMIGISAPESDISVSLRTNGSSITSGEQLFIIDGINFDSFDTGVTIPSESNSTRFGYQIQRDESGFVALSNNSWDKSRWLRVEDPREPSPSFDDTGYGVGALQAPNGLEPAAYTSTAISQPDFLFDRTAGGSGLRPSEDIPLFELLRQRPISIGELQHLKIIGTRPFSIGNSWAEDTSNRYNRLFDEAFFSGLAASDTSPDISSGEALPNHRLRTVAEVTGSQKPSLQALLDSEEYSSEQLLVEGAFNLNSTSSNAWATMLGSIFIKDWEVANINPSGDLDTRIQRLTVEMGQAILRFPQSAQEVYDTEDRESYQPPTEYFRVGAKFFRDSVGGTSDTEPYKDLAEAIVNRIGERISLFGPFVSIEEFLAPVKESTFQDPNDIDRNLSVMERAILDVAELNQTGGDDIWHHTSSFLSQADVMTGLAPLATTRGDTFVIRAVGRSQPGLSTGDTVTAICEAKIQRIPEVLDSSDDSVTPSSTGFGRKFVISSIRWVNE